MPEEDNRSGEVLAVAATLFPIASIAVLLRCYTRGFIVRAFGWDDAAMVMAHLWYTMFCICMIAGALYGTGRKFEYLTTNQRVVAMKYWWLCEVAYCFASVGCKVSVCIFLMRVTIKRIHHWILYTVMAMTVIAGFAFLLIMVLQCRPTDYFWYQVAFDPNIQGSCMDLKIVVAMTYVYSVFAAICDFTVGILPIFLVRKLNMKRKTKIAVVCILSMACVASCAVIIRMPFVKTFLDPEFLYATVDIALWSNTEMGLGITAGSMATLRPLLRHWFGSSSEIDESPGMDGKPSDPSPEDTFPMDTLDRQFEGNLNLRPDKLAVTVTTVQSQSDGDGTVWQGPSRPTSSEERLTVDQPLPLPSIDAVEMGMNVHRTFEISSSGSHSASVHEHV